MGWKQTPLINEKIVEYTEEFFKTELPDDVEYSWPKTIVKELTYYSYVQLKISVNNIDITIISPSRLTGICIKLVYVILMIQFYSGDQLNTTHMTTQPMCNLNIGYSRQGIISAPTKMTLTPRCPKLKS